MARRRDAPTVEVRVQHTDGDLAEEIIRVLWGCSPAEAAKRCLDELNDKEASA